MLLGSLVASETTQTILVGLVVHRQAPAPRADLPHARTTFTMRYEVVRHLHTTRGDSREVSLVKCGSLSTEMTGSCINTNAGI